MATSFTPEDRKRHLDRRKIETHHYGDFITKAALYALVGGAIIFASTYYSYKVARDYFFPPQPQIQEIGTDLEDKVEEPII